MNLEPEALHLYLGTSSPLHLYLELISQTLFTMTSRNATFNGHTNHVGQACDCQGRNQRQSNVVAEIDHQGCRNCFHSSAVIDALWNKIAKLDRQIVKVSAEKAAAEDALLCVIQVQAKAQAATAEQTRITSKAKNQVEPTFTSLTSSFSSNTTLAEPDSKDREQVSANLADKDALLIDLWAEEIDVGFARLSPESQ